MIEHEVIRRLRGLSESDEAGLRQLALDIGGHCRLGSKVVLDAWLAGPRAPEIPSAFICQNLQELAASELVLRADGVTPARRVHFLEMATTQQLAARELILTASEPLLQDETLADSTHRTCDAAYLLIRRLVSLDASEAAKFSPEGGFMKLDPAERSEEIVRFKNSAAWQKIFPA